MEQNFQTSFIPKKPMITDRVVAPRPVGFFVIISLFILFSVFLSAGGLYFYEGILKKQIINMEKSLDVAKNRFEPSKITELQLLNRRLLASTEILSKHTVVSPIFKSLSEITMKTVRYTKFSYNFGVEKNARVNVKISGIAVGYRSVALQSDLFAKNKNFIDPVFSNLALDEKGNVMFDLDFNVDPSFVDYKNMLLIQSDQDI